MVIDTTISRFQPKDVIELRNLIQAVLRALLSMDTETTLLDEPQNITMDDNEKNQEHGDNDGDGHADNVMRTLAKPTKDLVVCMREGVLRCDAALMDLSGHRRSIGPSPDASSATAALEIHLGQTIATFDTVESSLLQSGSLPDSAVYDSEIAQLFVFARHVREAAAAVQLLLHHVSEMQTAPQWPRLQLPSYPLPKAIYRTNAQIRHDRGGVVAGSYDATFGDIARLLDTIKSRAHEPAGRTSTSAGADDTQLRPETSNASGTGRPTNSSDAKPSGGGGSKTKVRYQIWRGLYRLQGPESKYALKACLVISLLAVPSYLDSSKRWWDRYDAWWAVAMSWVVMHPRVGGNLQDLLNRSCLAVLGAVWAGAAHAAGGGNPLVVAAFAAVYMLPMLYRYALSSHPRSGLVGSLSFTVVSLSLLNDTTTTPTAADAACRGLAFFVGTAAPMLVNWALWPFVARHELRAALSAMLFFLSVTYRSALATYVDFDDRRPPSPAERPPAARSHPPRAPPARPLRPPPVAALRHHGGGAGDAGGAEARLLPLRRDAVAAVLATLYVLAGALRARRRVPRYLPSAAAARKALLVGSDAAEEAAAAAAERDEVADAAHRRWSDIYCFSYNQSLTGCVVQLEEMEKYTKLIVGEQGFDDQFSM
ncbi:Brefeldin A-sensitivity protein 4 [Cordyceps fumosorosea ARSEF 2679]|uniref:Brefeldin A-sensitivity protein 4 n=1 Tax=Cordyceps fumosorosea (strain ARSEF 2679) TaxID=1081104 RepID=A0A167WJ93_CORFA|nr:Brefeldin A-sensitivity protein 4 [Cordyceps fumosorosea ARSEF 2679]OAA63859.1 Brefeldin A-sensitivity protein 4 [Cordyceps fumosorosea ARSEF 2679]